MRPIRVVSSANFGKKSSGERTQPWGAPVLFVWVLDENFPSLTSCFLSVRKLVIHWQMEVGTESCVSLFWRMSWMMVLKAELKSTNRILTQVPGLSRCCRMKCSPMLTASFTDLLLYKQTARGPISVQWRPSDKPKPVFQMIAWPQTLEPQVCSH